VNRHREMRMRFPEWLRRGKSKGVTARGVMEGLGEGMQMRAQGGAVEAARA
jgi:hypothetical protein